MVYHLGMGRSTGLVAHDPHASPLSGESHAAMDRDVKEIVEGLYARVKGLLELHRAALEALARALLERETLTGEEAIAVFQANGITAERIAPARLAAAERAAQVRH
jgi:ATP-dependent Zn protease